MGWRVAFGIGAMLGLVILYLRRFIPESPRWLITHGRVDEADRITQHIETLCGASPATEPLPRLRLTHRKVGMTDVIRTLFRTYPSRSTYCVVLMASQAFFYNAIFFTYALVLGKFFGIADDRIGLYLLPFAAGNFLGPLLLGHWFDTIGRKFMIAVTYAASGLLLIVTAWLFVIGVLDAAGQTIAWSIVFFFASAAASAAYLTVGESFPLEMRALAIAAFYSLGTALGGVVAPWLFGLLVGTGERGAIAWGYLLGSALMLAAAGVTLKLGVSAERRSLEQVARPLSHVDE
jgi:MFS family permease